MPEHDDAGEPDAPTSPPAGAGAKDADASAKPASGGANAPKAEEAERDWETRFKYLFADFENFRRRAERDRDALRHHARGQLLRGLLPIHDAFQKATESVGRLPPTDAVRRGIELLAREWESFLASEGVEPVARRGAPFREESQEAVAEAPVSSETPEGTIVEVVQQGYRFPGGVLRPAKVIVARPVPRSAASPGVEEPESSE